MKKGLTLVEVLFALVILGLVLGIFITTVLSGYRETSGASLRTQAVQLLNDLGRRVVGGEISTAGVQAWGYGELPSLFPELAHQGLSLKAYRASLENKGLPPWAQTLGVDLREYQIKVCWKEAKGERCVTAWTYAPPPGRGGAPPLPGIN
ncbi:MAG: type IV pilus modification PilV family protein [Thermaceae bacterium]